MILINSNTRQFNVPGSDLVFGVVADSDAERKHFQCPRYVGDGLDLAACFIRINYRNANGKTDFYLVDDMVIDGDNITFSWLLSPKVTEYKGQVKFVMCAVGPDLKLKWHTTQGTGQVYEGIEPDNSHVESQTADVVAQLIAMVEEQTTAVEKVGAEQVVAVKSAAETASTAAVNEIEAKGVNTRNSIPEDYTALSGTVENLVRDRAGGIVCSADGEVITLNDASDNYLRGLRIFGKSTQDGTPTPENPVEIVSVGDSGSVAVHICGKNLFTGWDVGGVHPTTGEDYAVTTQRRTDYIPVFAPGHKYNISNIPNTLFNLVAFYDANKTYISRISAGPSAVRVVEPPANAKYMRLSIYENAEAPGTIDDADAMANTIMIEAGETITEYEPAKAIQSTTIFAPHGLLGIPVTSGGNYTDENGQQWICDEVDFERGVYVQRVGKWIVDGTKTPESFSAGNNGGTVFVYKYSDVMIGISTDRLPKMCDKLQSPQTAYIGSYKDCKIGFWSFNTTGGTTPDRFLVFNLGEFSTQDEVANYLEKNPITFIGILATPIETPLSETELAAYRALHTNKPNTTIINDSGAYMSVDYTADTKLYIDNKIKEALL